MQSVIISLKINYFYSFCNTSEKFYLIVEGGRENYFGVPSFYSLYWASNFQALST